MNNRVAPPIPVDPKRIFFTLSNRILNADEFNLIISRPDLIANISYDGDSLQLDWLMQQLSQIKSEVRLTINKCYIDSSVCLPFDLLNDNTKINFFNEPQFGCGFNDYLLNCNDIIFDQAISKLDNPKLKNRLIEERKIKLEYLKSILTELDKRNININTWSNEKKMAFFYKLIHDEFPYDSSITNNGHWIPESSLKGGSAMVVYQRGKGICEGRSKLLKLVTNSKEIQLPCFLVFGDYGNDGHVWNEIVTEDGRVLEYDLSPFNTYGMLLSSMKLYKPMYKNMEHELPVENILGRK